MKYLVTGSTGFIGSHLCRALLERGHEVRAFHRACSSLRLLQDLPLELVEGDVTQPDTLSAAMYGVDGVFHLAAVRGMGVKQKERMYSVIVNGTRNVLQAAFQANVRKLVYTSSVAAMGVPESSVSNDETAVILNEAHTWNYDPSKWYFGYAKYLAEQEVQRAVAQGMDAVIVNPTIVMGEGDINNQTASPVILVNQSRMPIQVEGGINVIHIKDVVEGHIAAMLRGSTGERYILGGSNLSMEKLAEKIANIGGTGVPFLTIPAAFTHKAAGVFQRMHSFLSFPFNPEELYLTGYNFYYDTCKAQSYLGFLPSCTVEEAILEAYRWFHDMGLLPAL